MNLYGILRKLAPVAAVVLTAAASGGCSARGDVSIDGEQGKPLAELDLSGPAPTKLAMFGPDQVKIATGDKLTISVEGDPEVAEAMRFTLKDGTLGIMRKSNWSGSNGKATVNVTMPAPRELIMAGSGRIEAASLAADEAEVTIAGSGTVETAQIGTSKVEVEIAGSGTYRAAGTADSLKLSIAGSGSARLDALKVKSARVDVMGSGNSTFTSDGTVKANIMGSGEVRVIGRATCTVSAMGSGKLVCETPATDAAKSNGERPQG